MSESRMTMDFNAIFGKYDGTIVVYDMNADKYVVHNETRCRRRFTPLSTFKILNSIIALETGIIKNVDTEFSWDCAKYPVEAWWPQKWHGRHTMRTAINNSVVPFYREVACRIGHERMNRFVGIFNYGNGDISSGIDTFWLNGSLAISAMEQIAFLVRFYLNEPGLKKETIEAVKEILVQEKGHDYTVSAKTGRGRGFLKDTPQKILAWYVGYVERTGNVFFFALNIEGDTMAEITDTRIDITKSVLGKLNII